MWRLEAIVAAVVTGTPWSVAPTDFRNNIQVWSRFSLHLKYNAFCSHDFFDLGPSEILLEQ